MYLIRKIRELNILSCWLLVLQLGLMSSKRVDKTVSLSKIGAKLRSLPKYLQVTYNMNVVVQVGFFLLVLAII